MRLPLAVAALAAVGAGLAPTAMSRGQTPVVVRRDATFGRALFTPGHKAVYSWGVERKAGRILCTGSCATAWPPLIVRSRTAVPYRIAGVPGRFGVVRRPDGRLQVTYKGMALYTYADDPPNRILCDNVDRWFVVRV